MVYLVVILAVAVVVIEGYLTAKVNKEVRRLIELLEQPNNHTKTSHLDRARERKIEYR